MTRISPRTKRLFFTAPPAAARPWAARCSKTWATSRSTTSARSRIGPKAGARSTRRPSPAGERRAVDGWTANRARGPSRHRHRHIWALNPLQHRVEKFDPVLLQIPHHVFDDRRISRADQDVKARRGERSARRRLGARNLLLHGLLGWVGRGEDTKADALERAPRRLRRKQETDVFVACPRGGEIRPPAWPRRDVLEREAPARR